MSSGNNYRQDMPPPGGYGKFNWARTFPKVLCKPEKIAAAVLVVTAYGVYQAFALRRAIYTEKLEDRDLYVAMKPFLCAERDRRWLKLLKQNRDHEEKLVQISGDKAWKTGTWYGEPVYFTLNGRWWDPSMNEAYAHSPKNAIHEEIEFHRRPDRN